MTVARSAHLMNSGMFVIVILVDKSQYLELLTDAGGGGVG